MIGVGSVGTRHSGLFVSVIAMTALLLAACDGGFGSKGGKWGKNNNEEKSDPLVEVVPAWRGSVPTVEISNGNITPRKFAEVYARVTETVLEVRADIGDRVEKGQLLARLRSEEQLIRLRAAQLALQEAELLHSKNKLDLTKRKSELERIERYFDPENPQQATLFSKEAYEAAKLEFDKARNAVDTSDLALARARGTLAASALELSQTDIIAPISGTITDRVIRENEVVSTGTVGSDRQPTFSIVDFSVLEVELEVAEARASALHEPKRIPGVGVLSLGEKVRLENAQAVILSLIAYPQQRFLGYVDRINPTITPGTGMMVVTVRVIQPRDVDAETHGHLLAQFDKDSRAAIERTAAAAHEGRDLTLRPGMWVDARIATTFIEDALLIPGASIVGDEELIWVVTPDKDNPDTGTARSVDISNRRGINSEGAVQLLDAQPTARPRASKGGKGGQSEVPVVKEGSLIVVRGQSLLRDGQKVRIKDISS